MNPNPKSRARVRMALLAAAAVCVALFAWTIVSRGTQRNQLAAQTSDLAVPTVTTVKPTAAPLAEELVLPGTVQAFYEAPIFARTSGYLRMWYTDIGARVKRGALLAEIDTPEVDAQLRQAQADLATAQANYELAHITNERWKGLLATDSVSKQDADQKASSEAATQAALLSAEANVARLRDLESFKRVLAPFDGVVTVRSTDIGALINAGQASGASLFHMADTHKLRIYVQVPQPYAPVAVPGVVAQVDFQEHPGVMFPTRVVRTADALDPASRTLQVELQVDNPKGRLFPGSYAMVHFKLASASNALRVPVNTLVFKAQGLQVAVVGAGDKVLLRNIQEGRDFGQTVEVLSGIGPNDQLVLNPPDSIADGEQVRVVKSPQQSVAERAPNRPKEGT